MRQKIAIAISAVLVLGLASYAVWYSYNREAKIAQTEKCSSLLEHPKPPTMMAAPGGGLAPIYMAELCVLPVIPPTLWDLVRGRIVFEGVPARMKVNPYTLSDVLLADYTLGLSTSLPCDQSATTTDCSALPPPTAEPQPYAPPNVVEPDERWLSATNTPLALAGFSFVLPPGWQGSVYENRYAGGWHALVQRSPDVGGFVIDCPPDGKGFETARRLSSEERSFVNGSTTYSVILEAWTSASVAPWHFLWIRTPAPHDPPGGASDIVCLASGKVSADITEALQSLYETIQ